MSLELILGALIGGVTEALAGKAIDATPGTARKIQQTLSLVEQQTTGALAQAVQAAVDDARREMLESYVLSDDPVARDVTALFEKYELFAADVARRLIFQGQPDFARLRQHYLAREPKATSARWQALSGPLEEFFTEIENRLLFDGQVGLMLLGLRSTVALTRIDANTAEVATVLQSLLTLQERSTTAGESSAHALQQLVEQTQPISEIAALLRQLVAAPGGAPLSPQIGPVLSAVARTYLRTLRAECNRLPLADDRRSVNDAARQQADLIAQLINVYVDLRTADALDFVQEFALSFDWPATRLRVPAAERDTLRRRWNAAAQGGRGAKKVDAAGEATGALLDTAGKWEDHPLARAAGDEQRLRHALAPMTALEALQRRRRFALLACLVRVRAPLSTFSAMCWRVRCWTMRRRGRSHLDNRFDAPLFPIPRRAAPVEQDVDHGKAVPVSTWRAPRCKAASPTPPTWRRCWRANAPWFASMALMRRRLPRSKGASTAGASWFASVEAFCVAYPRCAVLVTSRVKPYDNPHYRGRWAACAPPRPIGRAAHRALHRPLVRRAGAHPRTVRRRGGCGQRSAARRFEDAPDAAHHGGHAAAADDAGARQRPPRGCPKAAPNSMMSASSNCCGSGEKRKADDGGKFIDLDDLLVEPDKRRVDVEPASGSWSATRRPGCPARRVGRLHRRAGGGLPHRQIPGDQRPVPALCGGEWVWQEGWEAAPVVECVGMAAAAE
jgi:hypothetical protein